MRPYYQDDAVTIYHGDCREWMPEADVIVSDPPYGIAYVHGERGVGAYGSDGIAIHGDDVPFDPSHLLAIGRPMLLWGANHYADKLPASPGWLVWDKTGGYWLTHQSDVELAWTNVLTTARVYGQRWRGVARDGREQLEGRSHTSQKPVALMVWCLGWMPDGVVLDPYMGSGSTLVAAKEAGRRAIGIEIEERYCEIAANRCRQEVLGLA